MAIDVFKSVKWIGNSKAMYNLVLDAAPEAIRDNFSKLSTEWIIKYNMVEIDEDMIFRVVYDISPMETRNKLMPALQSMRITKEKMCR